jgi:hypothetical protein
MHIIYTIGYSAGWTPATLKAELTRLGALLLDIRYSPHSRRPEWNRSALRDLLGDDYRHEPALGNRNYRDGGPIELAAPERAVGPVAQFLAQQPVALLGACRDAEACHRSVAATFLSERLGAPVVHLDPPVEVAPAGSWKVLSLNPPYGSLIEVAAIAPAWGKHNETRGHRTSYRGPLLIHQTKGLGEMFGSEAELAAFCRREPFRTALHALGYTVITDMPRGALVAACDLVDCIRVDMFNMPDEPERSFGYYTIETPRYIWQLANIRRIHPAIQTRGAQGMWNWTGEIPGLPSPQAPAEGTIYVDELEAYPQQAKPGAERYFGNGKESCHLSTDGDLEALHRFAQQIGLQRSFFQDHSTPHHTTT